MIINSLLDTDFYKLTMMQAVYHKYTDVEVEYKFKWRNWELMNPNISVYFFKDLIDKELDELCGLEFFEDELEYLSKIPFLKKDFIEFLRLFKLNRSHIKTYVNDDLTLDIKIKGPWLNTILFEVPVLAIISELYTKNNYQNFDEHLVVASRRLFKKIKILRDGIGPLFKYGDFGTRRRVSKEFHDYSIKCQTESAPNFIGTSNVYFAKKYGIKPLGTHAHEWFQAHQQLNSRLINSQKDALQSWADEYRGELGIALSDCITFDAFLIDFDKYFSKLFDGCRHDSGDPYIWVQKLIKHYEKLGVDPKTKTALFSDGLNFDLAFDLFNRYNDKINISFGVGTYLTNDCGFTPPQIVIKMTKCNGLPVVKISDTSGKGMCEDNEFESYLHKVINQKLENKI